LLLLKAWICNTEFKKYIYFKKLPLSGIAFRVKPWVWIRISFQPGCCSAQLDPSHWDINLKHRLFIYPCVCREKLASVSVSLAEAKEEVETWRSKAEDAREEAESLKLHLETQYTEKPVSLSFGLVSYGLVLIEMVYGIVLSVSSKVR
jgi:hypothetical protein